MISYKTSANWTNATLPNKEQGLKKSTVPGEYYQYNSSTPRGMTKLKVYKYAGVDADDQAVVTIYHNGKSETLTFDMNAGQDGWYEIGDYYFDGSPGEYVRFTRGSKEASKPTLTLLVTYEVMLERTTRSQTEAERTAVLPAGYRETVSWQDSSLASDNEYSVPRRSSEKGASATYNPGKLEAGKYEVFTYIPERSQSGDNSLQVEIFHDSKVETMVFDQKKLESGWFRLGEFDFKGAGSEQVKVTKLGSGEKRLPPA
ncbi:hypothetical protein N6H14_26555 [Paenibacillus sp. CC-CFT747]|nr:hypothetical protein N6H14_26555 [Paenibacillus sp. CC-CFT747]